MTTATAPAVEKRKKPWTKARVIDLIIDIFCFVIVGAASLTCILPFIHILAKSYDATRPNDTLTRAEALELAIKALKLFPINVYNDLYSDIVGHETYAGTIQCAAQNDLIPPEWVADGSLYPNQTVTAADFLAVLIPGAAGRRPLADAVPVPDSVPVYARRAVGQAVAEGLIAPEALTKPLNRSNAAEICRRLHI